MTSDGCTSTSCVVTRRRAVPLLLLLVSPLLLLLPSVTAQLQNEVYSVDLFTRENAKAHRTSAYEVVHSPNPALVIRRGDPFYLALQLRKPYDPSRDKIRLEFMYGPRPLLGKKTLIYLPVTTNREFTKDSSRWDARTHRVDGNVITVQVHVPAHVAVGVWRLRVSTKQQGSRVIKSLDARERIYILFNAWCKEDPVYLDNEDRRREYVLNDIGKIYIGSHSKPKGRKWIYGQVNSLILLLSQSSPPVSFFAISLSISGLNHHIPSMNHSPHMILILNSFFTRSLSLFLIKPVSWIHKHTRFHHPDIMKKIEMIP